MYNHNDNSNNDSHNQSAEENILLSIDIQLTETETGTLEIKENDDIESKVAEFCQKHHLSEQLKTILNAQVMQQLENQIIQLEEEEQENDDVDSLKQPNGNEIEYNKHSGRYNDTPQKSPSPSNNQYQSFQSFRDIKPNGKEKEKEEIKEQHSKVNKNDVSIRSQSPDDNTGARLYQRYFEQLPKKEEMMKKLREEIKDQDGKQAKFQPEISNNSKNLAKKYLKESNIHMKNNTSNIEERLLDQGRIHKERIMKEVDRKQAEEKELYTFKPIVPEKSQVIGEIKRKIRTDELPNKLQGINPEYLVEKHLKETVEYNPDRSFSNNHHNKKDKEIINEDFWKRDLSFDSSTQHNYHKVNRTTKIFHRQVPVPQFQPSKKLHDYLYIESKLIAEKKQKETNKKLQKECPFTPYIPQTVRNLINREETDKQFLARLAKTKRQREKAIIKQNQFKLLDETTGKKFFRPSVSRGPKNVNQRDISVNLNSYYDNKQFEEKRKEHEMELCNMLEKKKLYLERSMEIIFRMKFEKYRQIFNMLDSDNDGFISSRHIRLSVLDQGLLEAMTPLLEDLQKSNLNMNFKDFCLKVDKLLTVKIFDENEYNLLSPMNTTMDNQLEEQSNNKEELEG